MQSAEDKPYSCSAWRSFCQSSVQYRATRPFRLSNRQDADTCACPPRICHEDHRTMVRRVVEGRRWVILGRVTILRNRLGGERRGTFADWWRSERSQCANPGDRDGGLASSTIPILQLGRKTGLRTIQSYPSVSVSAMTSWDLSTNRIHVSRSAIFVSVTHTAIRTHQSSRPQSSPTRQQPPNPLNPLLEPHTIPKPLGLQLLRARSEHLADRYGRIDDLSLFSHPLFAVFLRCGRSHLGWSSAEG